MVDVDERERVIQEARGKSRLVERGRQDDIDDRSQASQGVHRSSLHTQLWCEQEVHALSW